MLKAVIFDLDGLLVDSTPIQQEANRIFIESFDKIYLFPESGREGMRIIDIIRDYKDIFDLPGSVEELYRKRQEIYYELVVSKLQLFPGVKKLLEKLRLRKLKIALATSGDRAYVQLLFKKFSQLKDYFSTTVVSEDVVRGKPYPDVYLKALQKLGVAAKEAIVLEDSFNGIAAAKAAGIAVICIPNRSYPGADYSGADHVFSTLDEVTSEIPG